MRKRLFKSVALMLLAVFMLTGLSGCFGKNALFNKVHNWNGTVGEKWVNSIVHFFLWVIPVYEICLLIDIIVLNTVEFWSGSNPLAMKEGESETQIVQKDGKNYQITATRNQFTVQEITDAGRGEAAVIRFNPENGTTDFSVTSRENKTNAYRIETTGNTIELKEKNGKESRSLGKLSFNHKDRQWTIEAAGNNRILTDEILVSRLMQPAVLKTVVPAEVAAR